MQKNFEFHAKDNKEEEARKSCREFLGKKMGRAECAEKLITKYVQKIRSRRSKEIVDTQTF